MGRIAVVQYYNGGVKPEQLWRAVGEILLLARSRKGWNASDVERHGGPSYHTVNKNERGGAGSVSVLTQHADALGLSIVDVLRSALEQSEQPLTPEAAALVRKFEATTVAGRQALLALAQALPDAEPEPPGPRRLPPAPSGTKPRNSGSGR